MFFILSMEETLRTSQEGFIPTGFVKFFTAGVLKKKERFYHLPVQRYSQNITFFGIPGISKSCFAFFSECRFDNVFARKLNHSTV